MINTLRNSKDSSDVLKTYMAMAKLKPMQSTLIVKVVDGQREVTHLLIDFNRDILTKALKLYHQGLSSFLKINFRNLPFKLCHLIKQPNKRNSLSFCRKEKQQLDFSSSSPTISIPSTISDQSDSSSRSDLRINILKLSLIIQLI